MMTSSTLSSVRCYPSVSWLEPSPKAAKKCESLLMWRSETAAAEANKVLLPRPSMLSFVESWNWGTRKWKNVKDLIPGKQTRLLATGKLIGFFSPWADQKSQRILLCFQCGCLQGVNNTKCSSSNNSKFSDTKDRKVATRRNSSQTTLSPVETRLALVSPSRRPLCSNSAQEGAACDDCWGSLHSQLNLLDSLSSNEWHWHLPANSVLASSQPLS